MLSANCTCFPYEPIQLFILEQIPNINPHQTTEEVNKTLPHLVKRNTGNGVYTM